MKNHKNLLRILIIFSLIIFCNIAYYVITNWQNFSINKNSSLIKTANLKSYSSSKMGFEVKYPALWVVQDNGDTVEINPLSKGGDTYFSVGLRNDFKSLDEIKKTLATDLPTTSIQINNASGFEYSDSDYHETIWLLHSDKIYLIRTYPRSQESTQILATFKFNN